MEQNILLRHKAIFWWNELHPFDKVAAMNKFGIDNYRISDSLTGREIEAIYLKEQAHWDWWNSLSHNEILKYSTLHIREVKQMDGEDVRYIYDKEHPTEAEVSKEEETVEEAADKYSTSKMGLGESTMKNCIKEKAFLDGAAWQKEKDRELISELLEALELANGTLGSCVLMKKEVEPYLNIENISKDRIQIFNTITKAEKHLNNQ